MLLKSCMRIDLHSKIKFFLHKLPTPSCFTQIILSKWLFRRRNHYKTSKKEGPDSRLSSGLVNQERHKKFFFRIAKELFPLYSVEDQGKQIVP